MSVQNPIVAQKVLCPIDDTADAPSIQFGGPTNANSGTGIYGSLDEINFSIAGVQIWSLTPQGMIGPVSPYSGSSSFQVLGPDLNLDSAAGKDAVDGTAYLAAMMGNVIGDTLSKTGNYIGGVIGAYSITTSNASTYPSGAVLAQITDDAKDADGAVVAYIDGDSSVTTANAAFKAMSNNSNAGSGFDFGLDLTSPAHDGYNALAILKADVRMSNDVCIMQNAGVPDSTVGANFAGPGSLCIDTSNKDAYINAGSKAVPVWKLITRAA